MDLQPLKLKTQINSTETKPKTEYSGLVEKI